MRDVVDSIVGGKRAEAFDEDGGGRRTERRGTGSFEEPDVPGTKRGDISSRVEERFDVDRGFSAERGFCSRESQPSKPLSRFLFFPFDEGGLLLPSVLSLEVKIRAAVWTSPSASSNTSKSKACECVVSIYVIGCNGRILLSGRYSVDWPPCSSRRSPQWPS